MGAEDLHSAPLKEEREGAHWGVDPESGATVVRLTSAPAWTHNIYCEQPYGSPDGRRVLLMRAHDRFAPSRQLLVADLQTLQLMLVEPAIPGDSVAHAPWGEWAYYVMADGSVRAVSLVTLERRRVCPPGTLAPPPEGWVDSATSDGRLLIAHERRSEPGLRSLALDLATGERHVLYEGPDNLNPHAQAEPGDGERWLFQLIRSEPPCAPTFVQSLEGGELVQLPFGPPHSAESSGHLTWVGNTGRVACAVEWLRGERRHDPRHPLGNLLVAAPGDAEPSVFPAPRHAFYHVSVSRCGRYFVCDDFMDFRLDGFSRGAPGPVRIVVGNLETGKSRVLIRDCQAYGIAGSSRYEPTPYFTADNRYVIYSASPFGLMQVFAAEVPPGFLSSLDG